MSVVFPGGNGMMIRIGLDGYEEDAGCACANAANNNPKMVTVTIFEIERDFIGSPYFRFCASAASSHPKMVSVTFVLSTGFLLSGMMGSSR